MCLAPAWRRAGEPAGSRRKLALWPSRHRPDLPPSHIPGCTAALSAARSDSTSSCHPRWGCCASGSQNIPSDGLSWGKGAKAGQPVHRSRRQGQTQQKPEGEGDQGWVSPGWAGPRVTLPSVHTHLFFSSLLWTSLVPILKPRQRGGSGRKVHIRPSGPSPPILTTTRCHRGFLPLTFSINWKCWLCVGPIHPLGWAPLCL